MLKGARRRRAREPLREDDLDDVAVVDVALRPDDHLLELPLREVRVEPAAAVHARRRGCRPARSRGSRSVGVAARRPRRSARPPRRRPTRPRRRSGGRGSGRARRPGSGAGGGRRRGWCRRRGTSPPAGRGGRSRARQALAAAGALVGEVADRAAVEPRQPGDLDRPVAGKLVADDVERIGAGRSVVDAVRGRASPARRGRERSGRARRR